MTSTQEIIYDKIDSAYLTYYLKVATQAQCQIIQASRQNTYVPLSPQIANNLLFMVERQYPNVSMTKFYKDYDQSDLQKLFNGNMSPVNYFVNKERLYYGFLHFLTFFTDEIINKNHGGNLLAYYANTVNSLLDAIKEVLAATHAQPSTYPTLQSLFVAICSDLENQYPALNASQDYINFKQTL